MTPPDLFDKRLIVVTGKGGVGKSTVSAALALAARRRGRRVLCCEVAAKSRLAPLLGVSLPEGTEESEIRELESGLFAVNVQSREAMREYALMKLKFQTIYNAVFENRLVRAFLRMVPSLAETVMLGKVWFEVEARTATGYKWDNVILDAPATGHGISFLRVPQVLMDTVPPGALREDAERMHQTLTDPSVTSLQLVTLPEEMPVNETIEMHAMVRDVLGIPLGSVFLNGWVAHRFEADEVERLEEVFQPDAQGQVHPAAAAAAAGLYQARRAEMSTRYEEKLRVQIPETPLQRLPRLYASAWSRAQIERLSQVLDGEPPGGEG